MKAAHASALQEQIRYELQRNTHPEGFPTLPEIPGGRYTSDEFYALEMEQLWMRSWLVAGREEEIAKSGQYKLFDRLGKQVIICRGTDGEIRAFHNTCRHRGAPIVGDKCGKSNLLVCRYHSWCYDLTGRLIRVPEEHDFGEFDKAEHGLLEVRCETWDGWIFLNFDSGAAPLLDDLGQLVEDLAPLDMANLRIKGYLRYEITCNWKAALDAFLEAYHVKAIHPQTVDKLLDGKGTSIAMFKGGHTRMALPKRYSAQGGTWGTDDVERYDIETVPEIFRANNCAYGIFPNFVAPFDSGGFPLVTFWPTSRGTCECELIFVGAGPEEENAENSEYWRTFVENYDKIQQEDFQFLAGIQRSLDSGAFTGMTLCYQERRIYWMHEEFDRRIGIDRIPEDLRVKQLLAPFTAD
ncbi:(2Fe-2S)-binding protein [Novosphingobium marinum]|uniref:Nitrite reductase/ring-hydroxylating ferredoxin subunit n=1 Tax=Novosphingobium marinum TaxID=1514948 RepID=A0A7Y9XT77_9SPHN|nr:SRPBCC family protein [Novosphingobium marinum]NYH94136.1 nitrite reductase/ring-hydroxylating ferredoxin subunit [Novosphingobium marinum]GGC19858.1 (2Fe-2S)-binding protein [Novosphingobium marinum]